VTARDANGGEDVKTLVCAATGETVVKYMVFDRNNPLSGK